MIRQFGYCLLAYVCVPIALINVSQSVGHSRLVGYELSAYLLAGKSAIKIKRWIKLGLSLYF